MPKRKTALRRRSGQARRKLAKRKPAKRKAAKRRPVKRTAKRASNKKGTKRRSTLRRRSGQARAVAKPARKASPARKAIVTKAMKKATQKNIGRTTHYYDRIGVAIVELAAPLHVGDAVTFKRGENEHTQAITSMQIDHTPVTSAKKGDVVGIQVTKEIHEGAEVLPA